MNEITKEILAHKKRVLAERVFGYFEHFADSSKKARIGAMNAVETLYKNDKESFERLYESAWEYFKGGLR